MGLFRIFNSHAENAADDYLDALEKLARKPSPGAGALDRLLEALAEMDDAARAVLTRKSFHAGLAVRQKLMIVESVAQSVSDNQSGNHDNADEYVSSVATAIAADACPATVELAAQAAARIVQDGKPSALSECRAAHIAGWAFDNLARQSPETDMGKKAALHAVAFYRAAAQGLWHKTFDDDAVAAMKRAEKVAMRHKLPRPQFGGLRKLGKPD